MDAEARFDPDTGTYVWGDPEPVIVPIEPAFIRKAVVSDFEPASDAEVRAPRGVTTFADVYPRGTSATDAPEEADFDPLADWRVPGEMADDILISLPDGTPRMLRTVLTLL